MTKVLIYGRQSSGDDERSESVELQLRKLHEVADREQWDVVADYTDLNVSGKCYPTGTDAEALAEVDEAFQQWYKDQTRATKFREGLGELLKKLSGIDYVMVWDITRLMRPITGSHLESFIVQKLKNHQVKVWQFDGGIVDFSSFETNLLVAITSRINDNQIAIGRKKSMAALKALKDKGMMASGKAPIGYKWVGKHRFEIVPEEAEQVKYAYGAVLKGINYATIVKQINDMRGIPVGKGLANGKGLIMQPSLMRMLANPIYAGLMYDSEHNLIPMIAGQYEPLISEADWRAVQVKIQPHRQGHTKSYLYGLTGLVRCGYCGRGMSIASTLPWDGGLHHAGEYTPHIGAERVHRYTCPRNAGAKDHKECQHSSIKYSAYPVPRIGTEPVEHPIETERFRAHCQKYRGILGTEPTQMEAQGIYEGIMPLLALELIEIVREQANHDTLKGKLDKVRYDLMQRQKSRGDLLDLVRDGVADMSDVKPRLETIRKEETALKAEEADLRKKLATSEHDAQQKVYAELVDIQNGTLHPSIYKELAHRVIDHIDAFASCVVVYLKNGKQIKIERVCKGSVYGMPQSRLDVIPLHNGTFRLEVTYYYKTCFDAHPDDEAETIYDDGALKVITRGRNRLAGTGNQSRLGRVVLARLKTLEKDRELGLLG